MEVAGTFNVQPDWDTCPWPVTAPAAPTVSDTVPAYLPVKGPRPPAPLR